MAGLFDSILNMLPPFQSQSPLPTPESPVMPGLGMEADTLASTMAPPAVGSGTPADPSIALVTNMFNLIPKVAAKAGVEPPGAAAPGASGGATGSPAAATAGAPVGGPTNIVPPGMDRMGGQAAAARNPLGAVRPPPQPQGVMASSPGAPQQRPAQSNLVDIMMSLGSGRSGSGRGATQLPFLSKFLR